MAYQYRKFINFFASLPTQVVIKVYQYTCFIVFWVYIWRYNDVMNDTVILFFGLYLLLNFFLFLMQYNRAIVRPVQSQDLVAVLVISMAQVIMNYLCIYDYLLENKMSEFINLTLYFAGCPNYLQHCFDLLSVYGNL